VNTGCGWNATTGSPTIPTANYIRGRRHSAYRFDARATPESVQRDKRETLLGAARERHRAGEVSDKELAHLRQLAVAARTAGIKSPPFE
jgi:hypothetical protein